MSLKRLMARIAAHRDAITRARLAGLSWSEIGERMGAGGESMRKAYARAQMAMDSGRLLPLEQLPLPDQAPTPVPAAQHPQPCLEISGRDDSQSGSPTCVEGMASDKLHTLVSAGPDPSKGLQHLVLSRFADITLARAHLRRWDEIANALDIPGREKALSVAFARVRKGIAEKRLEPPRAGFTDIPLNK